MPLQIMCDIVGNNCPLLLPTEFIEKITKPPKLFEFFRYKQYTFKIVQITHDYDNQHTMIFAEEVRKLRAPKLPKVKSI